MRVLFFFQLVIILIYNSGFSQGDSVIEPVNIKSVNDSIFEKTKSEFYLQGNYFYTFRDFTDLSAYQSYYRRADEAAILTKGIEVGALLPLSQRFKLSIGASYVSAGEQYSFESLTNDSTFQYINKYQQVAIPLRLYFNVGNQFSWFAFVGAIPSSIIHKRIESNYTDADGKMFENEVVLKTDNISAFQISATAGTGIKYNFDNASIYLNVDYRKYLSNTYTGLFLEHKMYLIGGALGFSYLF